MPHSVLVVPVREAEELVARAHITLLSRFAAKEELTDGLLGELDEFFADCLPWSFQLAEVTVSPSGTTYLAPDPVAPFRSLANALAKHFAEFPQDSGQFGDAPHLSVPDGFTLDEPIAAYARSAELWWYDEGTVATLSTFPFGTTAA